MTPAFRSRFLAWAAPGAGALAIALWIYWPAVCGRWLWDDRNLIVLNPTLRTLRGLGEIWFAPNGPDYFPLTATVQWIQWHLWGPSVVGYHLTNVGLHALSGWLVWRLFLRLGVSLAWLGALLFLVHPLAVESVAWISELKNALSMPPLLLAMIAFVRFVEHGRKPDHGSAIGWFFVAMLCKSSVVTFPVVLLLYGWWRRGRIARSDLLAALPFFLISLALGVVTWRFQQTRAIGLWSVDLGGPLARFAAAGLSLAFYLGKCFWPVELIPIYPPWNLHPLAPISFWPWAAAAGLAAAAWVRRAAGGRTVLFGGSVFAVLALPILGLVPISFFLFAPVADHFIYLSLVPMAGLVAAGSGSIAGRLGPSARRGLAVGLIALCVLLAGLSRSHAQIYRSEAGLWIYTLQHNPRAATAEYGLGQIALEAGQPMAAIPRYEQALRLQPDDAAAQLGLANALVRLPGRSEEALPHFEAALRINPRFEVAHLNYANLLATLAGRQPEALSHYEAALRINPNYAEAENNFATALAAIPGRSLEAIAHYRQALRINPDYAQAHSNLANLLAALPNRMSEAFTEYDAALRINPNFPPAHYGRAVALATLPGRLPEAIAEYRSALRLDPQYAEAHYNLAVAYVRTGRYSEAIVEFESARQLNPSLPGLEEHLRQLRRATQGL